MLSRTADHLYWMSCYTERAGEAHPSSLIHHYIAYRAVIRAKALRYLLQP